MEGNNFFNKIIDMDSRKTRSERLNLSIMEVKEILESAVGVKNKIEDDKRISIRGKFHVWAKEVQDFGYKFVSLTNEAVDANVGVDSSKYIG